MSSRSRGERHRATVDQLDDLMRRAAQDPELPSVSAMVEAPLINFRWQSARPGPSASLGSAPDLAAPFRIASITKTFVAATVLRLVETNVLTLEHPVAGLLSNPTQELLAAACHDPSRITIDHLLTHTSGLPDHASLPEYEQAVLAMPAHRWSRAEQLALALQQPPVAAAPGLHARYSDTGYVLLGEIIERATELPLGVAVRHCIDYRSLGLNHTWWEDDEAAPADLPPRMLQRLGAVDATSFDASFDRFGGGGLVSTLGDLVRFASELFRGGVFRQTGTLAAACVVPVCARDPVAVLHSRLAMVLPMGSSWGWGHLGYWGCGVLHCPSLDITVAATVNQPYPSDAAWRSQLVSQLGGIVVDLARDERR